MAEEEFGQPGLRQDWGQMSDQMFFFDLENLQGFDLDKVPASARIKVFVSQTRTRVPTELVR